MTTNQDPVDALIAELDAISDPVDRFQKVVEYEGRVDVGMRAVRQRIAAQLYNDGERTYREVGQIMGGVTASRAEQIVKGR
ncbi:MAG: hypothetical protein HOV77_34665 [Hamadaea sp.]|uniref:hypothetical protein n=1 Tax=Hamadaea sp. TaxID=2024425 RepID=UPI0017E80F24|nr:hypothetical protein [Hamadaea sp.]NUT24325.1 hypothetical protein [Hamadaea sp.]